ncbi:tetratricopeptide repeat protein [Stieleria varia]|uniref:Tetratricopeptide repeat protein n=1 Tax=Stieleria varia TaxID=2528005 RepID=A0A5C6ALJ5_9BACT|nr:tetratricopeptide repeat protein [Stieleria varia]TWU00905.1 Tetratricopeptide repeat protein [Stieleria varia]
MSPSQFRPRVFVSYTGSDLREHAAVVNEVAMQLGAVVTDYATSGPTGDRGVDWCKKRVAECDILVVLVAHRYGWIPPDDLGGHDQRSITWLEVEAAEENGLVVCPTVINDSVAVLPKDYEAIQTPSVAPLLAAFKQHLSQYHCPQFSDLEHLRRLITSGLQTAIETARTNRQEREWFSRRLVEQTPFVGRQELISEVKRLMFDQGERIIGLYGAAGVGKSYLAYQFAYQIQSQLSSPGVLIENCSDLTISRIANHFLTQIDHNAALMDLAPGRKMTNFFGDTEALLVFDNVDDPSVGELIPEGRCRVIITTSNRSLLDQLGISKNAQVCIPPLSQEAATELLGISKSDELLDTEWNAAQEILKRIDCNAWAVDFVGRLARQSESPTPLTSILETISQEGTTWMETTSKKSMQATAALLAASQLDATTEKAWRSLSVCPRTGFSRDAWGFVAQLSTAEINRAAGILSDMSLITTADGFDRFFVGSLVRDRLMDDTHVRESLAELTQRNAHYYRELIKNFADTDDKDWLSIDSDGFLSAGKWMLENATDDDEFWQCLIGSLSGLGFSKHALRLADSYMATKTEATVDIAKLRLNLEHFRLRASHSEDVLNRSIEQLHQCESLFAAADDRESQISCSMLIARALESKSEISQCIALLRTALITSDEAKLERTSARLLVEIGRVHRKRHWLQRAEQHFESAIERLRPLDDPRLLAEALHQLALVKQRSPTGKHEALELLDEAIPIAKSIGASRQLEYFNTSRALLLSKMDREKEAVALIRDAINLSNQHNDLSSLATQHSVLAGILARQKEPTAEFHFLESIRLCEETGKQGRQVKGVHRYATFLKQQHRRSEAATEYLKESLIHQHLGQMFKATRSLIDAISMIEDEETFEQAIRRLETLLPIVEQESGSDELEELLNIFIKTVRLRRPHQSVEDVLVRFVDLCRTGNDDTKLGWSLRILSSANRNLGHFEEAIKNTTESLHLAEATGNSGAKAKCLVSLGATYRQMGELEKAREHLEQGHQMLAELDYNSSALNLAVTEARALRQANRFSEAKATLEHVLRRRSELDAVNTIHVLLELGTIHRKMRRLKRAIQCLAEAVDIAREHGFQSLQAVSLSALAQARGSSQKFDERTLAFADFEASEKILRKLGWTHQLIRSLIPHSALLLRNGKFEQSIEAIQEALSLCEKIEDWRQAAHASSCLALIHRRCGEFEQAFTAHEKAIAASKAAGNDYLEFLNRLQYAVTCRVQGNYDEARIKLDVAEEMIERASQRLGSREPFIKLSLERATLHCSYRQPMEAIEPLLNSLKVAKEDRLNTLEYMINSRLGDLYLEVGKHDLALPHYEKIIASDLDANRDARAVSTAFRSLSEMRRTKAMDHALDWIDAFIAEAKKLSRPNVVGRFRIEKADLLIRAHRAQSAMEQLNLAEKSLSEQEAENTDRQILWIRGQANESLGNPKAAVEDYRRALELWADDSDSDMFRRVQFRMTKLLRKVGSTREVIDRLEIDGKRLKESGNTEQFAQNQRLLAREHSAVGHHRDAISVLQNTLRELPDPSTESIRIERAFLTRQLGSTLRMDQGHHSQREAVDRLTESCALWREIADRSQKWSSQVELAKTQKSLAFALEGARRHEEALELLQQSMATFERLGDGAELADSYTCVASRLLKTGHAKEAVFLAERAVKISEKEDSPLCLARALSTLGQCYGYLTRLDEAVEVHKRMLHLNEAYAGIDQVNRARAMLASTYIFLSRFDAAERLLREVIDSISAKSTGKRLNPSDGRTLEGAYAKLARAYRNKHRYNDAIEALRRALDVCVDFDLDSQIPIRLLSLAACYADVDNSTDAISRLEEAYRRFEKQGRRFDVWLPRVLTTQGVVHHKRKDYDTAISQFRRSLQKIDSVGDQGNRAVALNALGHAQLCACKFDDAIVSLDESLEILQKLGNELNIGSVQSRRGHVLLNLDRHEEAREAIDESHRIAKRTDNTEMKAEAMLVEGLLLEKLQQTDQACKCFRECADIFDTTGDLRSKLDALRHLARVLKSSDNPTQYQAVLLQCHELERTLTDRGFTTHMP